jgi:hypothetical protein
MARNNICLFGIRPDRMTREKQKITLDAPVSLGEGEVKVWGPDGGTLMSLRNVEIITLMPIGYDGRKNLYQLNRIYVADGNRFNPGSPFILDAERRQSQTLDPFWEEQPGGKNNWTKPSQGAMDTLVAPMVELLETADRVSELPTISRPQFYAGFNRVTLDCLQFNHVEVFRWGWRHIQEKFWDQEQVITNVMRKTSDGGEEDYGMLFSRLPWEGVEETLTRDTGGDPKMMSLLPLLHAIVRIAISELDPVEEGKSANPVAHLPLTFLKSTIGVNDVYVRTSPVQPYYLDLDPRDYDQMAGTFTQCNNMDKLALRRNDASLVFSVPGVAYFQLFNGVGRSRTNGAAIRASRMMNAGKTFATRIVKKKPKFQTDRPAKAAQRPELVTAQAQAREAEQDMETAALAAPSMGEVLGAQHRQAAKVLAAFESLIPEETPSTGEKKGGLGDQLGLDQPAL